MMTMGMIMIGGWKLINILLTTNYIQGTMNCLQS